MKHFLVDGRVHAYEADGSQDAYIPEGAQPITQQQADDLANPVPSIEARRAAAWAAVKAERSRRKDGGVQVSGHWFQTDSDSRIQLMRLDSKAVALLAGGGAPTDVLTVMGQPIPWKTTENGLVPMTAALAQNIVLAVEVLDAMAFGRAEVLRQQIEASESPELIDISTGWPVVYGGAE